MRRAPHRVQINNLKYMCNVSRDSVLCRGKAILCTKSQLLSPSVWTPVLSPPQVSWADWSTWELPCLFKNSRAQTPNYEYAKQQGREAHLFHGLAGGQTFFFFSSRRIALSPWRLNWCRGARGKSSKQRNPHQHISAQRSSKTRRRSLSAGLCMASNEPPKELHGALHCEKITLSTNKSAKQTHSQTSYFLLFLCVGEIILLEVRNKLSKIRKPLYKWHFVPGKVIKYWNFDSGLKENSFSYILHFSSMAIKNKSLVTPYWVTSASLSGVEWNILSKEKSDAAAAKCCFEETVCQTAIERKRLCATLYRDG